MVHLPIHARSPNVSLSAHRMANHRIAKKQRADAHWSLKVHPPALPCVVTLCRISPRSATGWKGLDSHDNLQGSLKHVADGVADWLGVADSDGGIRWQYTQEPGNEYGVRVSVESAA